MIRRISQIVLLIGMQVACDQSPTPPTPPPPRVISQSAQPPASMPEKESISKSGLGADVDARALTPLSEHAGRIRRIVMHAPSELIDRMWTPIHDLLSSTGVRTRLTFVCNNDTACEKLRGKISDAGFQMRANVQIRRVDLPMRIWARDRYIATTRPNDIQSAMPTLLVPQLVPTFDNTNRAGEREIPRVLNDFEKISRIAATPLILEGGNVLAAGKHVFIGANAIQENAGAFVKETFLSALSATFKPRVFLIADDSGRPPIAHIDMMITVVADDNVLVGSPGIAAGVMQNADAASRKALDDRLYITPDMPDPKGPDFTSQRIARFDQVAAAIERAGYRVTRIPYADSRNGDFIVSYNNVLQESDNGRHVIYMPIYQIPALDAAARKAYESLGCEVKPIDVSTISHLLGAIRCMANVVERE